MKFEDYRKINLRTNKWLGSPQLDLAHALIGMTSEINELEEAIKKNDEVNISEELSDILWYVSLYLSVRDIPTLGQSIQIVYQPFPALVRNISLLNDIAKKWIIYNKEIDQEKENQILTTILTIAHNFFLSSHDNRKVDIERGLQNNIDKLRKRYPNAYSDELAQNRNLEVERRELEK